MFIHLQKMPNNKYCETTKLQILYSIVPKAVLHLLFRTHCASQPPAQRVQSGFVMSQNCLAYFQRQTSKSPETWASYFISSLKSYSNTLILTLTLTAFQTTPETPLLLEVLNFAVTNKSAQKAKNFNLIIYINAYCDNDPTSRSICTTT